MKQRALKLLKLILECDAGMKQGIVYYRTAVANGSPQALELLKRAVRLPYRIEARVQDAITKYGQATVNGWLTDNNCPNLATLQTMLAPYKTYSDTLKNNYQVLGWTEDQIASDIETNRENIDQEAFPIPPAYVDDL